MAAFPEKMNSPVFRLRGVCKSYRRGNTVTQVLRGVDFDVSAGECVFLVGPSGCGKTTLLSVLGCMMTPEEGEVAILGQDVRRLSAQERTCLRRDHLGFVFQKFHLVRGLSVADNVQLGLTLQGIPVAQGRRRALELLEAVGLAELANAVPRTLSTGQCQRVALARALAAEPAAILADEPTASLDAENGQEVMHLLNELARRENKTVVVVTHDQRIFPFADRICRMVDGQVTEGKPEPVLTPSSRP